MKTFTQGCRTVRTLTVGELIEFLTREGISRDLPVFAEWEGTWAMIKPDCFFVQFGDKGKQEESPECLIINVDHY